MTEPHIDRVVPETNTDCLQPPMELINEEGSFLQDPADEVTSEVELSWRDYVPQILACLAGSSIVIQAGVNMAFSSILLPQLMTPNSNIQINVNEASWVASLVTISTPFGSLLSGTLMDKIGRKAVCKLTSIPLILSWILVTFVQNVYALYFARILAGFGSGLSTAALMYMSEVSHPKLRPMLLCLNSVYVSLGILISCTLGLWLSYQGMAMTFAVMSLVSYMVTWPLPESPYWLATFRNMNRAELALRWLNRTESCYQQELHRLVISVKNTLAPSAIKSFKQRLLNLSHRSTVKPLAILLILFIFQQLSGAYVVIFYAVNLFKMIGGKYGSGINEYNSLVLLGLIRFIMSIVAAFASRRIGRRPLCILSGLGMAASALTAAIYIYNNSSLNSSILLPNIVSNETVSDQSILVVNKTFSRNISLDFNVEQTTVLIDLLSFETTVLPETTTIDLLSENIFNITNSAEESLSSHEHWVPLACLLIYVSFSAIGFLVIPWTLTSELLPISIRGTCGGFMIAFAYIIMFIVVKTFPYFLQIVKADGMFFTFSFISLTGAIFVYIYLPETLGKSFQEIEDNFT